MVSLDPVLMDDVIAKTLVHNQPRLALLFVSRVADAAQAVDHYPDIDIRGSSVVVAIGSHSAGITEDDLHLAHRIERLVGDQRQHPPGLAGP
jgi:4a-hydroxytetrahydrobiopterin dehydratase